MVRLIRTSGKTIGQVTKDLDLTETAVRAWVLYAIGALAGARPGEVPALEWADLDSKVGLIHLQRSVTGPTKDSESRHVPLVPALAGVLEKWRKHCPVGATLVFPAIGHSGPLRERGHVPQRASCSCSGGWLADIPYGL